ncbi:TPA: DUF551 domain-containing protein [Klebsiella pneumoniae]|nr:DUF551 domain-containing protein [Klebsiella pneumoniae]
MTKSTITRDELNEVIATYGKHHIAHRMANALLAAMDSEPVIVVGDDGGDALSYRRLIQSFEPGTKLYRHAQPAPEYPDTLPCPVLLEPGLRFGKGIKTSTMLAALARRAVYESDMAALSPEERAEFQARIEDFKALIAQPVPVVPQDVLEALQKVARIRLDLNDFDGDRRGIADCLCDAEEALIEVVNRRAAMLAAAKHDTPAMNSVQSVVTVPGKWIPVREQMPESKPGSYEYLVFETLNNRVNHDYWNVPDKGDDAFAPFWNYYGGHVTHWMPLPAAPKEAQGE